MTLNNIKTRPLDDLWGADSWRGDFNVGKSHTTFGCNHWRQPVRVGRFVLTCSAGASAFGKKIAPPHPDFGVYLAPEWKGIIGDKLLTNGAALKRARELGHYPAVFASWDDMQAPKIEFLARLVDICLAKLRAGKSVDIGCGHAHGRAGSLLAALVARVEHLEGYEAIKAVHDRYCRLAVETPAQQHSVLQYAHTWRKYEARRR